MVNETIFQDLLNKLEMLSGKWKIIVCLRHGYISSAKPTPKFNT